MGGGGGEGVRVFFRFRRLRLYFYFYLKRFDDEGFRHLISFLILFAHNVFNMNLFPEDCHGFLPYNVIRPEEGGERVGGGGGIELGLGWGRFAEKYLLVRSCRMIVKDETEANMEVLD